MITCVAGAAVDDDCVAVVVVVADTGVVLLVDDPWKMNEGTVGMKER